MADVLLIASGACILSGIVAGWMCRTASAHGLVASPNARSSHTAPTPTAGGVGILVASLCGFVALYVLGEISARLFLALSAGGAVVGVVGLVDDRRPIDPRARLAVHLAAAAWAVSCLGGAPAILIGERLVDLGLAGSLLATLVIAWWVNLFNFMDGIDGIAASQAGFMGLAGAVLTASSGASPSTVGAAVLVAAASLGFLWWNWPPSRIFMGDVGSGFLGFALAVLALHAARESPIALWVWLVLGAVFLADATVTLIRRMLRREKWHTAHRTHAYQWLARRWGAHRPVTLAVIFLNVVWLFPAALLAQKFPSLGPRIALAALAAVVALVLIAGAGRAEPETRR